MVNNNISKLTGNLEGASEVHLDGNRISNFDINLKGVSRLPLRNNPIQHLDLSSADSSLRSLYLSNTSRKEFIAGKNLKSMFTLELNDNPLKKIDLTGLSVYRLLLSNTGLGCFDQEHDKLIHDLTFTNTLFLADDNLKSLRLTLPISNLDIRGNSNIDRIQMHSFYSRDSMFKVDDYSIACDCCFLKVLYLAGFSGQSCRLARI